MLGKSVPVDAPRTAAHSERTALWVLRIAWVAHAALAAPAIAQALEDRSRPVQLVAAGGAWTVWFVGLLATLVPSTLGLTVLRMILPGALGAALLASATGASPIAAIAATTVAGVALVIGFSGDVGQVFVGGSAYGDETRLVLRPPGPLLIGPVPVLGALTVAATISGPLLLAARAWWWGAIVSLAALALVVLAGRRFHVLSCRWLVFVPAGLVVHDPFVLAETVMFRRAEVDGVELAEVDTDAADLTGAALGTAVEVRLTTAGTVVLAPTRSRPGGTALHVRSFLVSPTRPGRALAEARRRGVGG